MEVFIPFACLFAFLSVFGVAIHLNNKKNQKFYDQIIGDIQLDLIFSLNQADVESSTSGLQNRNYIFTRCDIYVLPDALILLAYNQKSWLKQLSKPIIISKNLENCWLRFPFAETHIPKKVNINSFGGDFYLTFGESGFWSTSVDIRIKNLTNEQKTIINTAITTA